MKYVDERGWDIYVPKRLGDRGVFGQERFSYDAVNDRYQCPQGAWLKRGGQRRVHGVLKTTYRSPVSQSRACPLKACCTRKSCRSLEVVETAALEQALATKLASPSGQAL